MLIFVLPLSDSAYVCFLYVYDIIYTRFFFCFVLEILPRPASLFLNTPKLEEEKIRIYKFKQNSQFPLLCHLNSSVFFLLFFSFFLYLLSPRVSG